MSPSRRQFLLASVGWLAACAGCSSLSGTQQDFVIAVNNYSDVPRQGFVTVECDGTEQVRQYVEVGAAEEDEWRTVETRVDLGRLPDGTRIDVTASFGDGLETDDAITLSCASDSQYTGDIVYVQLDADGDIRLVNTCYAEFPSQRAQEGGAGRA
jgi:hypothetical protein